MSRLVFAFAAGLLSPANPCGFAMLPAFVGYYLGSDAAAGDRPAWTRIGHGFAVGAAVSAGFAGVFVAAGLVISAGLRSLVTYVPWAAVLIGVLLAAAGVAMLAGRHIGLRRLERLSPGQGRGLRPMVVFGAAYAAASLSCTIAVLLAVVAQALASANPVEMVAVFVAYGLGGATVLTVLSVSTALASTGLARGVRRLLPFVVRLGGVLLIASGLYLIAYWLPVLSGGLPNERLASLAMDPSNRLRSFLDRNLGAFTVLAGLLVVVGAAFAVALRRRSRDHSPQPAGGGCTPQEAPTAPDTVAAEGAQAVRPSRGGAVGEPLAPDLTMADAMPSHHDMEQRTLPTQAEEDTFDAAAHGHERGTR